MISTAVCVASENRLWTELHRRVIDRAQPKQIEKQFVSARRTDRIREKRKQFLSGRSLRQKCALCRGGGFSFSAPVLPMRLFAEDRSQAQRANLEHRVEK
jgi:hypothetical protein